MERQSEQLAEKLGETNRIKQELSQKVEELTRRIAEQESEADKMRFVCRDELEKAEREHEHAMVKLRADQERSLESIRAEYESQIELLRVALDKANSVVHVSAKDEGLESADESENEAPSLSTNIQEQATAELKTQIELTKELDKEIIEKLKEKQQQQQKELFIVPDEIKDILEKVESEGIRLLSLSEILKLKRHLVSSKARSRSELDERLLSEMNETAMQSERDRLVTEVCKLKELLSQVNKKAATAAAADDDEEGTSCWRSDLLRTIAEIFAEQREFLAAELRSFVCGQLAAPQNAHEMTECLRQLEQLTAKVMRLFYTCVKLILLQFNGEVFI